MLRRRLVCWSRASQLLFLADSRAIAVPELALIRRALCDSALRAALIKKANLTFSCARTWFATVKNCHKCGGGENVRELLYTPRSCATSFCAHTHTKIVIVFSEKRAILFTQIFQVMETWFI